MIRKLEFFCSKEGLRKHSRFLGRVFERQEESDAERQVRLRLPDSTKPDVLAMFIDFVDRGKEFPARVDLYVAQNVVTIAEALKMREVERRFLLDFILPMLNRDNVIFFLKLAYQKLQDPDQEEEDDCGEPNSKRKEEEWWIEFFEYALDMAAANIQYILRKRAQEFHAVLEKEIIDEVVDRAIKFYRADLHYDAFQIFETLLKTNQCDSYF